jgi:phosphate:Na+ symporter
MSAWITAGGLLGGIGLFLLGMGLMTDGLKLAAGPALALDALEREVRRMGGIALRMVREAMAGAAASKLAADQRIAAG